MENQVEQEVIQKKLLMFHQCLQLMLLLELVLLVVLIIREMVVVAELLHLVNTYLLLEVMEQIHLLNTAVDFLGLDLEAI